MREEIDKRAMALLSGGHLATDLASGTLPALLPFFKERFDLSYTLAALLILASTFASSIIQPFFGHWADRYRLEWMLPAGITVAGLGIGLGTAMPSYWLLLLFVVISGFGVAAFHPEASRCASFASGPRRASGMSLFQVGGNIGFGLGPIVAVPLVSWLGIRGGLLIAVPTTVVGLILLRQLPRLAGLARTFHAQTVHEGENNPRALALLLTVITLRGALTFGLITFVPLYVVGLGHSKSYGSHLLALMLLVGGAGTLFTGPLADRVGRRPVLIGSTLLGGLFTVLFIQIDGPLGAIGLAGVGLCTIATYAVQTLMCQEYMPQNLGMASGLAIGLSSGLAGVAAVVLGAVADSINLKTALWLLVAAPVVAFLLALKLPATPAQRTVTVTEPSG